MIGWNRYFGASAQSTLNPSLSYLKAEYRMRAVDQMQLYAKHAYRRIPKSDVCYCRKKEQMNNRITTDFEHLSFHDADISEIRRETGKIFLQFSGAYVGKSHPSAEGLDWRVESGCLTINGVTQEKAIFWSGDRVSEPHPNPAFPLDEVMTASYDGTQFKFAGFLDSVPWYEWIVVATGFELIMDDFSVWKGRWAS